MPKDPLSRKRKSQPVTWKKAVISGGVFGALISLGFPHVLQNGLTWGHIPWMLFFGAFFAVLTLAGWAVAWILFDSWRRKPKDE